MSLDSAVAASGGRLAAASGPTYNFLLPDPHGSAAGSLSADQSTVTSATRYDAWGDTIATGAAGGTPVGSTAWKYRGRLDVSPAGLATPLYAMGARLYDPGVGAFTSLDTVAGSAQDPLSMNRFLYAAANPATLVDPTGHTAILVDDAAGSVIRQDWWTAKRGHGAARAWSGALTDKTAKTSATWRARTAARTGYKSEQVQEAQTASAMVGNKDRVWKRELAAAQEEGKWTKGQPGTYTGCELFGKPCGGKGWGEPLGPEPTSTLVGVVGGCAQASAGAGFFIGVQLCDLHQTKDGTEGLTLTLNLGSTTGVGASVGVGPAFGNATNIDQYRGLGSDIGGSFVPEVGGGVDIGISNDHGTALHLTSMSIDAGVKGSFVTVAEGHGAGSGTLAITTTDVASWLRGLFGGG